MRRAVAWWLACLVLLLPALPALAHGRGGTAVAKDGHGGRGQAWVKGAIQIQAAEEEDRDQDGDRHGEKDRDGAGQEEAQRPAPCPQAPEAGSGSGATAAAPDAGTGQVSGTVQAPGTTQEAGSAQASGTAGSSGTAEASGTSDTAGAGAAAQGSATTQVGAVAGTGDSQACQPADGGDEKGGHSRGKALGHVLGPKHHQEAVAKVVAKLEELLPLLNGQAAANVQAVIDRLKASVQAEGVAKDEEEAEEAVKAALEARHKEGKAAAVELDALAHLKAKDGDLAGAAAVLEERLAQDHRALKAYEKLGELYEKLGVPGLETFVNGKKIAFDVRPVLRGGRTLVPVRAIVQALGAQVQWDAATRTVTITLGDRTLKLDLEKGTAELNGQPLQVDVPPAIEGGRTVIPLRLVMEAFGLKVTWLEKGKVIVITQEPLDQQPAGSTGGSATPTSGSTQPAGTSPGTSTSTESAGSSSDTGTQPPASTQPSGSSQ